nr:MAG TPA: hypothetical protein [Caudoviricetes sp.]
MHLIYHSLIEQYLLLQIYLRFYDLIVTLDTMFLKYQQLD